MTRTDRWILRAMALFVLLATPFVLLAPRRTLPFEGLLEFGASFLQRPSQFVTVFAEHSVVAAGGSEATLSPLVRSRRAGLEESLEELARDPWTEARFDRSARAPLLLRVSRSRGQGASSWPEFLELDLRPSDEELRALQGSPAVHGANLLGFVAPMRSPTGQIQIRLLSSRKRQRESSGIRLLATAKSAAKDSVVEGVDASQFLPQLRLIVGTARRKAPHPLRVLLSNPRKLDTWSPGHYPYVARTRESHMLEVQVPAGLVLGVVEDIGYLDRGLVLERYLRPLVHPDGLVHVVLYPKRSVARALASRLREVSNLRLSSLRRHAVLEWSSAAHRALLSGADLVPGAALFFEGSCMARVRWARSGLVCADGLANLDQRVPAHAIVEGTRAPVALLLRGAGYLRGLLRFEVLWPATLPGEILGAELLTGTDGHGFLPGFRIGTVQSVRDRILTVSSEAPESWPLQLRSAVREMH